MIQSRQDYKDYIEADKAANHVSGLSRFINKRWQYIKCMRKVEYIKNCKHGVFAKIQLRWQRYRLERLSVETGISIAPNTFGKGLYVPHHGAIVVNESAKFGDNCVIQCGVNVSANVVGGGKCYLGTGAKLMMGVHIADYTIVGANAVVTKSFDKENIVLAGIPAKIISENGYKDRTNV